MNDTFTDPYGGFLGGFSPEKASIRASIKHGAIRRDDCVWRLSCRSTS